MQKVKDICLSAFLILLSILIINFLFHVISQDKTYYQKYTELEEEYDNLKSNYDDLTDIFHDYKLYIEFREDSVVDDLWSCEDDIATLSCYFYNDTDITFEEAENSFDHLNSVYIKHCHY